MTPHLKRILLIGGVCIALLVLIGLLGFFLGERAHAPTKEVEVLVAKGPLALPLPTTIEVVDTPKAEQKGLGDRTEVPDDYGMLFIFPNDGKFGFWMKDMLVPIDIIWITAEGKIVTIEKEVAPDTYPNVFYPTESMRYVLETKAGYAEAHGWKVGTVLDMYSYTH